MRQIQVERNPYDDEWRFEIDARSKYYKSPFKKWFGNQKRIYLPFETKSELSKDDLVLIKFLKDNDYELIDYKLGHVRKKGKERISKIPKALESLRKRQLEEARVYYDHGLLYNLKRELSQTEDFFRNLMNDFNSSSFRIKQKEYVVVMSIDPHDIARMSTDRPWTSCMTLGAGERYEDVFCEVENGGFIAYLIRPTDLEINRPVSRILIRRFDSADGHTIALPEETIYGLEVDGFLEFVQGWVAEKQGDLKLGSYSLKGGQHSDTFGSTKIIFPKNPTPIELVRWFMGHNLENLVFRRWVVRSLTPCFPIDENELDERVTSEFDSQEEAEAFAIERMRRDDGSWRADSGTFIIELGDGQEIEDKTYWTRTNEDGYFENQPLEIYPREYDLRDRAKSLLAEKIIDLPVGSVPDDVISEVISFAKNITYLRLKIYKKFPDLLIVSDRELPNLEIDVIQALSAEKQKLFFDDAINTLNYFANRPLAFAELFPKCSVCRQAVYPNLDQVVICPTSPTVLHHAECANKIVCKAVFGVEPHPHYLWAESLRPIWIAITRLEHLFTLDVSDETVNKITKSILALSSKTPLVDILQAQFKLKFIPLLTKMKVKSKKVLDFYESMTKYWGFELEDNNYASNLPNIDNLGYCIAQLGTSGHRFIPFVESRVLELEHKFGLDLNPNIAHMKQGEEARLLNRARFIYERYLYILDMLQHGRTVRYRW